MTGTTWEIPIPTSFGRSSIVRPTGTMRTRDCVGTWLKSSLLPASASSNAEEEFRDVVGRSKLSSQVSASRLSPDQLLERYLAIVTVVQPQAIAPTILEDPTDDHVLACARAARADLIVSGDRHLLKLEVFEGIPIATAAQALERIASRLA